MRLEDFRALPTAEQAELIAVYRVSHQIEAVMDYEQHRNNKRLSKGKG